MNQKKAQHICVHIGGGDIATFTRNKELKVGKHKKTWGIQKTGGYGWKYTRKVTYSCDTRLPSAAQNEL